MKRWKFLNLNLRVRVLLGSVLALVSGIVLPTTAYADSWPSQSELVAQCNGNGSCVFTPGEGTFTKGVAPLHQVGATAYNCTKEMQEHAVSWQETESTSNSISVSESISGNIAGIIDEQTSVQYQHEWGKSTSFGETDTLHIPAMQVGWIEFGPPTISIQGEFKIRFEGSGDFFRSGNFFHGHAKWLLPGYAGTAPDPEGNGNVVFKSRPMTDVEVRTYCSGSGVGKVQTVGGSGSQYKLPLPKKTPLPPDLRDGYAISDGDTPTRIYYVSGYFAHIPNFAGCGTLGPGVLTGKPQNSVHAQGIGGQRYSPLPDHLCKSSMGDSVGAHVWDGNRTIDPWWISHPSD